MAKIIKVGSQNITPNKIANPFKTSRNSTTNPFKYSNFEGNTLQFADVFEGFEPKKSNKLKLIASSVAGSMHKMRLNIFEPISNFVSRVRTNISNAWDYAKSTNISDLSGVKAIANAWKYANETNISEVVGIKNVNASITKLSDTISDKVFGIKDNISSKFSTINTEVTELGKSISENWNSLIARISPRKINSEMSVSELETLWRNEIQAGGIEA